MRYFLLFALLASQAYAAETCTVTPDGRIFCVPAGGGPSIYRP